MAGHYTIVLIIAQFQNYKCFDESPQKYFCKSPAAKLFCRCSVRVAFLKKLKLYQTVLTNRCSSICSKIERFNVAMLVFFYFWKHLVKFQGKSATNTHETIFTLYVSHNLNTQNPQQDHHTSICYQDFTRKNIFASIGNISRLLVWIFNFLPRFASI